MSDPLTDLISDIQNNGVRWVTLVTLYSLYRKERRNTLLNRRDAANFQNQREVMKALGVEDKWKDGPKHGLLQMDLPIFSKSFLSSHRDTIPQRRRMGMLQSIMKANLSKKLISAVVSIAIASLNYKYHLNIPEEVVWGILGLSLTHISLQTIIDSIKAWAMSKTTTIIQQVTPAVERAIVDTNTKYQDVFPQVKEVHAGLKQLYTDIQLNDGSKAFLDAVRVYNELHAAFEAAKPAAEIPDVVA